MLQQVRGRGRVVRVGVAGRRACWVPGGASLASQGTTAPLADRARGVGSGRGRGWEPRGLGWRVPRLRLGGTASGCAEAHCQQKWGARSHGAAAVLRKRPRREVAGGLSPAIPGLLGGGGAVRSCRSRRPRQGLAVKCSLVIVAHSDDHDCAVRVNYSLQV